MKHYFQRRGLWRARYLALTIIALALFGYLALPGQSVEKERYQKTVVHRGELVVTLVATGVVQPQNRVAIKPPVSGRIEKVLVNEGDTVKAGQTMAWMSSNERAALLDAARNQGPEMIAEWEKFYRPTPILAPIDGAIIQRLVQTGQSFSSSEPVFVLADRLTVKTLVDETDIAQIRKGQSATVVLDAYNGTRLAAHVDHIAYDAKTINSITTYEVDVVPQNAPEFMRSGMTGNVTFQIAAKKDVVLAPAEAVRTENGAASVLVPSTAGMRNTRAIQVGASDGKIVEVVSGLADGETILIPEVSDDAGAQGSRFFGLPKRELSE